MSGQVIVVDDEVAIREAVQQWLELSGFSVHSCATAQAALALVDRDYPGIIISDVRMPGPMVCSCSTACWSATASCR